MSLVRTVSLAIQTGWNRTARQWHLRELPPVPTILVILVIGLGVPLAIRYEARATALTTSLAVERLDRYARKDGTVPSAGPAGAIYAVCPAYYWPKNEKADHYRLRVYRADGIVWSDKTVVNPYYVTPRAGELEEGKKYRFEIQALDKTGQVLRRHQGVFSVRKAPTALRELRAALGEELDPFQRSLALLGYYAGQTSPHDVVSGVLATHAADPADFDRLCQSETLDAPLGDWFQQLAQ